MEGRIRASRRRFDELITLAWHTEAFARTKRLPPLAKVLRGEEKQVRAQTPEQMIAVMRSLRLASR